MPVIHCGIDETIHLVDRDAASCHRRAEVGMHNPGKCPFNHSSMFNGKLPSAAPAVLSRSDIENLAMRGVPQTAETTALELTMNFLRGFVGRGHPHLGRSGSVCPFAEAALTKDLIRFQTYSGPMDKESIKAATLQLCDYFLKLSPTSGPDKISKVAILIFPTMERADYRLIDEMFVDLISGFHSQGLIVGQLHPGSEGPGIRNPEFRPLRSPVPMVVIRHLSPYDLIFKAYNSSTFADYTQLYTVQDVPSQLRALYDEAANQFGYPESSNEIHPRVFQVLRASRAVYEVITEQTLASSIASGEVAPETTRERIGSPTESHILRDCDSDVFVVVVTGAGASLNLNAVRRAIGLDGLAPVDQHEVEALTSQPFDAVSPIGQSNVCTLIDSTLFADEYLLLAAGRVGCRLKMTPARLRVLTNARTGFFTTSHDL